LVYKLYKLTSEEIEILEGKRWSLSDYEDIQKSSYSEEEVMKDLHGRGAELGRLECRKGFVYENYHHEVGS